MVVESVGELELHFDAKIDSNYSLREKVLNAYKINKLFFGCTLTNKCIVHIIYKREEMDEVCNEGMTESWLAGTTTVDGEIYIFSPTVFEAITSHSASEFDPILTHELAHVFTNEIIKTYRPVWLSEGLAGYVAGQCKNKKPQDMIDFEKLHSRDDWNKKPSYTQAYHFTAFLIEKFGKGKLIKFLKKYPKNNGARESFNEFLEFFASFFKINFKEIVQEWQKKELNKGVVWGIASATTLCNSVRVGTFQSGRPSQKARWWMPENCKHTLLFFSQCYILYAMENIEKEQSLFIDNVAEESQNILENEAETNEHIAYVKKMLATISAVETKQSIADYGINKLSEDEDVELATYFFILSNLKEFSKDVRDFFTDAMVYCEAPEYKSLMQLKEQYKKIRPTI